MRLINIHTLEMKEFFGHDIPRYAILSHRWTADEVDFKDFQKGRRRESHGFRKVLEFCEQAKIGAHVEWAWADTVCIDKRSSMELSEAINSMFQWYEAAEVCYVHLFDVHEPSLSEMAREQQNSWARQHSDFFRLRLRSASWFTRGWTLQELLAPKRVLFFSRTWILIGSKCPLVPGFDNRAVQHIPVLTDDISSLTSVPHSVLTGEQPLQDVSVAGKMSWLSRRSTTRIEDMAYCSIGIFGIHIPLLYGEGANAFQRLQEEIIRTSNDESIFAWFQPPTTPFRRSLLASAVTEFHFCGNIETTILNRRLPYSITNQGLELRLEKHTAMAVSADQGSRKLLVPLNCSVGYTASGDAVPYIIVLEEQPCGHYDRLWTDKEALYLRPLSNKPGGTLISESQTFYVHTSSVREACLRASSAGSIAKTQSIKPRPDYWITSTEEGSDGFVLPLGVLPSSAPSTHDPFSDWIPAIDAESGSSPRLLSDVSTHAMNKNDPRISSDQMFGAETRSFLHQRRFDSPLSDPLPGVKDILRNVGRS